MLYEILYPVIYLRSFARIRNARPEPQLAQFRSLKSRLRRLDIHALTAISPFAGAWLALHRFERTSAPARPAGASQPIDRIIQTEKGRLAVRFSGDERAKRVLLIHGWNADSSMILPLVTALTQNGFRVIYPDLPGDGASTSKPMSFHEKGRMIARYCAVYGPFDCVIGHSAGGLIAAIALEEGLQAHRLVTICAPQSLTSLLQAYLVQTGAPERLQHVISHAYRRLRRCSPCDAGHSTFARFQDKLLVIHANSDWQVLVEEAYSIVTSAPQAKAMFLDDCNHRSILGHPSLVEGIAAFLGGYPETARWADADAV
ncbi:Alpha/beta hydrolase family protein [Rhizobium mongolense subsp. loessense]|uniref:Alpha/beta hydrolase family protein n=2 Tax=Rhizobium mongolense TaxID=57676 RepID=A0A1G4U5C6_9HYPH|nr:Alpha/beta hydrolase family protein [Rhizobium mongolense subsp. loessense]